MFVSSFSRVVVVLSCFTLLLIPSASAQLPQASDMTSPPVPGSGHDYLAGVNETVNPANGCASIRIPVIIPPSRGITLPFSFAYDSCGAFYYGLTPGGGGPAYTTITNAVFAKGGWSYTFPILTYSQQDWTETNGFKNFTCEEGTNYVFQDPAGNRHNLGLAPIASPSGYTCGGNGPGIVQGGDGPILATTQNSLEPCCEAVTVTDGNGTVYSFANAGGKVQAMPASITDRNGNVISISWSGNSPSTASVTDTVGRTAISVGSFGANPDSVTIAGLGSSYKVYWTTVSPSFTINADNLNLGYNPAPCPTSLAGSASVVSQIVLPNLKSYQFDYSSNPYGMLDKIYYPSGGYVRYAWGLNLQAEYFSAAVFDSSGNVSASYTCRIDFPAITDRYVSFDGTHEVLHQHFSYGTSWQGSSGSWTTKTTTTTTSDPARNTSFNTSYTYSPINDPCIPDLNPNANDDGCVGNNDQEQMPYEQSVQYNDTNGSRLKTVTKGWHSTNAYYTLPTLSSVQTTLNNNQSSLTVYCYNSSQLETEHDDYDLGNSAPTLSSCAAGVPSGTVSGPLLRKTTTTYATSTAIAANHVVDLPASVIIYDGNNNRMAETDFTYDNPAGSLTSGVVQHSSSCNCGNLTQESRWLNTSGTFLNTTYTNDDTGQRLSMIDPCGNSSCSDMNVSGETHTTTYSYADSYTVLSNGQNVNYTPSGNTNAYLTTITYPTTVTSDFTGSHSVQHVGNFTYDFNNGQLTIAKDQNGQPTTYLYNDSLARLKQTNYPDGGQTTISYNDSPPSPSITTSRKIDNSGRLLTTVSVMDGLGHTVQNQLTSDPEPNGTDYTDTTYDGSGRVWKQSNPHRSASLSTDGTTTQVYDALGRTCLVVPQDAPLPSGSACPTSQPTDTVFTTYSGNCTTVIDEAGKSRQYCSDGLGRLSSVVEDPGASNHTTNYTYDALDNLTSVVQNGSRQRSFGYDSLSRLTASVNPESGTIYYSYDANGNLFQKAAPAPNQTGSTTMYTTHGHDALNREIWKNYGTTNNVQFVYDQTSVFNGVTVSNPIGRLTSADTNTNSGAYPTGSVYFGYDQMGRVTSYFQCVLNCSTSGWSMYYTYDLLGDITSYTNGLGATFTQNFDNAGRLYQITSTLSDPAHPGTLATADSSVGFWPNGGLRKVALGNGLYETTAYNSRLQPCRVNVNSTSTYTLTLCTDSLPAGNIQDFNYGFNSGSSNNGNVASWQATGGTGAQTFNRSYAFDPLNRLKTFSATSDPSGCNGLLWNYDAWGNRTSQTTTAGACFNQPSTTFSASNQLPPPYQYDAAGNMTNDGSHQYFYDEENRVMQVDGSSGYCSTGTGTAATACYLYDAEGKRVQKKTGATQSIYLYDLNGHVINEVDGSNATLANYIYFNGGLLAEYKNATTYFVHKDHLGSTRLMTAMDKSICDSMDYLPFGEQLSGGTCTTHKFTGKERDSESGLDNFGARYNSSSLGRFMSVDPVWVKADRMLDPQRLNLYAYGRNNPLKFTDPSGMDVVLGKCSGGDANKCFNILQQGLRKEDRSHVHLVKGNGKNGFKKGQFGVTVDADYKSDSKNFQTLQTAANDHSAVGRIDVLKSGDTFKIFGKISYDRDTGWRTGVTTVTFNDDFEGYTYFQFRGKFEPGVDYTAGQYTDAVVSGDNTAEEVSASMHHELRHIVLGDFGRSASRALHSQPGQPSNDADKQTAAADKEALENAKQP